MGWSIEAAVDAALVALPAILRNAIVLRYLKGMSEADAAAMAVRKRVQHGLERLRV
jgi:DNA-directed RNA polymerase specialized sigma24 family protein